LNAIELFEGEGNRFIAFTSRCSIFRFYCKL